MRHLFAMAGLGDAASDASILTDQLAPIQKSLDEFTTGYDKSKAQLAALYAQYGASPDVPFAPGGTTGSAIFNEFVAKKEIIEAQIKNYDASRKDLTAQQNILQKQLDAAKKQAELDKKGADAATYAATPAGQANAAKTEIDKWTVQAGLLKLPGRYDFGAGSGRRNKFYHDSGMGANMQTLLEMDRPTMGFDVWGAVSQGVQNGVKKYIADPNKGPLPQISTGISLPSFGLPSVGLPSWLSTFTKPFTTVGKSVEESIRDAQKKKTPPIAGEAPQTAPSTNSGSGRKSSLPMLAGVGALALVGVYLYKRSR